MDFIIKIAGTIFGLALSEFEKSNILELIKEFFHDVNIYGIKSSI